VVKGSAADATDTPQSLRLVVQTCDDEKKDDQFFFIFPSKRAPME
jgi:hypothetical protein